MTGTLAPYPRFAGDQPCARHHPETFFPVASQLEDDAATICYPCPYLEHCLAYALTHDVQGVWGGTTYRRRRELRKRWRLRPARVQIGDVA